MTSANNNNHNSDADETPNSEQPIRGDQLDQLLMRFELAGSQLGV